MKADKIYYLDEITKVDELVDAAYHANKQNLNVSVMDMRQAFYEQHKSIYGSNRDKYGHDYYHSMQGRHMWIMDKIWEVIECKSKIKYINDIIGKKPIQIKYNND